VNEIISHVIGVELKVIDAADDDDGKILVAVDDDDIADIHLNFHRYSILDEDDDDV